MCADRMRIPSKHTLRVCVHRRCDDALSQTKPLRSQSCPEESLLRVHRYWKVASPVVVTGIDLAANQIDRVPEASERGPIRGLVPLRPPSSILLLRVVTKRDAVSGAKPEPLISLGWPRSFVCADQLRPGAQRPGADSSHNRERCRSLLTPRGRGTPRRRCRPSSR